MSLNRTTGQRAARARLGRAAARLGGLPQWVVTWAGQHHADAAAVIVLAAAVAAGAIILAAPPQPGGAEPVRLSPAAGASAGPTAGYLARPSSPVHASLPPRYIGVYEPEGAGSYAAGTGPAIAISYSGWYGGFKTAFADDARTAGAIPLIQIEPRGVSLAAIARGKYDPYLRAYADVVAGYRGGVVIGFGQEMNERLYTWGYRKTSPAVFVQAWRRIVNVFRSQHADNVTWIWTIGKSSAQGGPLQDWWPGARYVDWVGIDGYYALPGRARLSAFAGTIDRVRRITRDAVLLFGNDRSPVP
ncbi:MAG TPA: glycosyl hydrolase [Streptosporangiaceae bacterium]|nr:glycosyl hydrolase [Streptosporangiaceae bacterium]